MKWEVEADLCAPPCVKREGWWGAAVRPRELSSVLCDGLDGRDEGGGREAQDGGGVCLHPADSLCCMAETNATL